MRRTVIFYLVFVTALLVQMAITDISLVWTLLNLFLLILLIKYAKETQKKGSGFLVLVEMLLAYIATIFIFGMVGQEKKELDFSNLVITIIFLAIDGISLIVKYGFAKTVNDIHPRQHF